MSPFLNHRPENREQLDEHRFFIDWRYQSILVNQLLSIDPLIPPSLVFIDCLVWAMDLRHG